MDWLKDLAVDDIVYIRRLILPLALKCINIDAAIDVIIQK